MLGKLLCFIGLHSWDYTIAPHFKCCYTGCGKLKHKPPEPVAFVATTAVLAISTVLAPSAVCLTSRADGARGCEKHPVWW